MGRRKPPGEKCDRCPATGSVRVAKTVVERVMRPAGMPSDCISHALDLVLCQRHYDAHETPLACRRLDHSGRSLT